MITRFDDTMKGPVFRGRGGGGGRGQGRGGRGGGQGFGQGGGGRAMGPGGLGLGPTGSCVCPNCGWKAQHQPGIPCMEQVCEKCGARMQRVE